MLPIDSDSLVVVDGAGDRYRVLAHSATFALHSLDRPDSSPFWVDSATLRPLGLVWDGRTLKGVDGAR